jgi:two-component system response regulator RegX3
MPILFISARGGDDDILLGLGVGADDYIAKPYSLAVLHAKVQAVLRRLGGAPPPPGPGADPACPNVDRFAFAEVTVRFDLERVFGPAGALPLTALEYRLLACLARSPDRVVPRRELFADVWGHTAVTDGTLNVHVRRLRAKLATAAPGAESHVKTVWGVGYVLDLAGSAGT